jgi:hypothetical protein
MQYQNFNLAIERITKGIERIAKAQEANEESLTRLIRLIEDEVKENKEPEA